MSRKHWILGLGALLAVLGALLWHSERLPEPTSSLEPHPDAVRARRSGTEAPTARGARTLKGRVLGSKGPVAGATVIATLPEKAEALSEQKVPCPVEPQGLFDCRLEAALDELAARLDRREGEAAPVARATTDAEGRFALEGLDDQPVTLWAEASGAFAVQSEARTGQAVELQLVPGVSIEGRILTEGHRAIAGATVTALPMGHARRWDTTTDAQGRYTLPTLPDGDRFLLIRAEGYMPERFPMFLLDRRTFIELELRQQVAVVGRVVARGQPVSGATVQMSFPPDDRHATTDGEGRFRIEHVASEPYGEFFAARSGDLVGTQEAELPLNGALEIELKPGGYAVVTVSDEHGPVAGAEVSSDTASATTDAMGVARVGPLKAGAETVYAVDPARMHASASVQVVAGRDATAAIRFDSYASASGVVVDEAGKPLAGVEVSACATLNCHLLQRVETGADGAFVLDKLNPGERKIVAHWPIGEVAVVATAPVAGLRLVAKQGLSLSGVVLDDEGQPVHGVRVAADGEAWTGPDGRFRLEHEGAGPKGIRFKEYEGAQREGELSVELAAPRDDLVLRFEKGATLSGVVRDPKGAPVADALLELHSTQDDTRRAQLRSGPGGAFALKHLTAGPYALSIKAEGFHDAALASVAPGQTGVQVTLQPLPSVHGRVVHEDGTPLASYRVNGQPQDGPGFMVWLLEDRPPALTIEAQGFELVERPLAPKGDERLEVGDVMLQPARTP